MANELAADAALLVARIKAARDSFTKEDPLRHAKADLRRAAESTIRLAFEQANTLLQAAQDLQKNLDDVSNGSQE